MGSAIPTASRPARLMRLAPLAVVCAAFLVAAGDAQARWAPGLVFHAPAMLALGPSPPGGGVFVDDAGNVRWSGSRGMRGPALWRSRSRSGHLTAPKVLRSAYPTIAVNDRGEGLVAINAASGAIVARRRSPSGEYAIPMRRISPGRAWLQGAAIDDRGSSLILYQEYKDASDLYARRMSRSGRLGAIQRVAHAQPDGRIEGSRLTLASSGHAAVAFTWMHGEDGQLVGTVEVVTAGPEREFGVPRAVSSYRDPGVDAMPTTPRDLDLAISGTGTVAVSWIQAGRSVEYGVSDFTQGDVYVATARPGAPFAVQSLAAGDAPDQSHSVAFSPSGAAMVTWAQTGPSRLEGSDDYAAHAVYAAYSLRGDVFGVHRQLEAAEPGRPVSDPQVAFDRAGTAVVAWSRGPGATVVAAVRNRGRDFTTPRRLGTGTALRLAGGGRGVLALAWTTPGSNQIGDVRTSLLLPG